MRSTAAVERVNRLLVAAESDRCCLIPTTRADAEVLRRGVKSGRIVRPFPSMYLRKETWDRLASQPRVRWRYVQRAYLMEHPGTALCSFSAALEYGFWVSKRYLTEIHVVAPAEQHGRRGGRVHRHQCPQGELTRHEVADVTTIERTVLDCSLAASFEDALAIADSAIRFMGLDKEKYGRYVAETARHRAGAAKAMKVARYMDGGSENGGESIVRGKIIALGYLPPTSLQVEFIDPVDGGLIRVDMYYELPDGSQLIVEVDGKVKYVSIDGSLEETRDKLLAERNRESHISKLGIPVMRVQFGRIYEDGYLEHLLKSYGVPKAED